MSDAAPTELKAEHRRWVEVDGVRLQLHDLGSGPVLVCTHGGGPGATAWGSLSRAIEPLAEHFRLLLVDLPNFGGSQMGVTPGERAPDIFLAQLLAGLLDALGIEQPVSLYTSSGGGPSALRFAIDFPERTRRLVIQAYSPGMAPYRDSPGHRATRRFLEEPTRERMAELFELFIPDPARRDDAIIEERFAAAVVPGHLEHRAAFATLGANSDISPSLAELAAEVLFVWGAADRIVPVERVLHALQVVPRSRAQIWGGQTGHLVPFEHPEQFARVVTSFLSAGA